MAIVAEGIEIARHARSYEAGVMVCDPRQHLGLIEREPGALDQAAPLQGRELPPFFAGIRRLLEARAAERHRYPAGN